MYKITIECLPGLNTNTNSISRLPKYAPPKPISSTTLTPVSKIEDINNLVKASDNESVKALKIAKDAININVYEPNLTIFAFLHSFSKLEKLYLFQSLNDTDGDFIITALKTNKSITSLYFEDNNFTQNILSSFDSLLNSNQIIKDFRLIGRPSCAKTIDIFTALISKNTSLCTLAFQVPRNKKWFNPLLKAIQNNHTLESLHIYADRNTNADPISLTDVTNLKNIIKQNETLHHFRIDPTLFPQRSIHSFPRFIPSFPAPFFISSPSGQISDGTNLTHCYSYDPKIKKNAFKNCPPNKTTRVFRNCPLNTRYLLDQLLPNEKKIVKKIIILHSHLET